MRTLPSALSLSLLVLVTWPISAFALDSTTAQPANLDDAKAAVMEYYKSGRYGRDVEGVARDAQAYLASRLTQVARPAIVLDIDETAISNWPRIEANDFGYIRDGDCTQLPKGPCGALAWTRANRYEAVAPVLALYRFARAHGVAVFFVTGRGEAQRDVTAANLRVAGYEEWTELMMLPTGTTVVSGADHKAPARAQIEANGYTIVVNVGDQTSDLAGGHAERAFLLPNPFYRVK